MRFRARPITPCGEALAQESLGPRARATSMNETVYLFALSVPELLEVLVTGQAAPSRETPQPEPEERAA